MNNLPNLSNQELVDLQKTLQDKVSKFNNYQTAKKEQLNSAYGAMGSEYFRFYDISIAEAITLSGQLVIQWLSRDINQYINRTVKTENIDYVIAIDTDSIYLNLDKLVSIIYQNQIPDNKQKIVNLLDKVSNSSLQKVINQTCTDIKTYLNTDSQRLQMKREIIADKAIWTAKKRYVMNVYDAEGVRYEHPVLEFKGLEAIKSSTPEICRQKIRDALRIIMNDTERDLHAYIKEFRDVFSKLSPEDIASPRGCKGLVKYGDSINIYSGGTPIHVRGALLYNYLLKKHKLRKYPCINEGDKIKFTYLKMPNPSQNNVIAMREEGLPKEFGLHVHIDYDLQFQKAFVDPLQIVLNAIGWSTTKKHTLDDFFQ